MEKSKNKDIYCLKVKEFRKKDSYTIRREFNYSLLNDYEKMSEVINNAIKDIKKKDKFNDKIPVYILNHPENFSIMIYNKKLWDFYYKYNLINECVNNKILRIEFFLYNEKEISKIENKINNKKDIMKNIMKKIPFITYVNTFIKLLKKKNDFAKEYGNFLITEILNENINDNEDENNIDNIDEIIKIDRLVDEVEESIYNDNENKKLFDQNYCKDYFLHGKDYYNIINEKFKEHKDFPCNVQSFNEIKKLFDDDEINNIDKNKEKDEVNLDNHRMSPNTSLSLQKVDSFQGISLLNDDNNFDNNFDNNPIFSVLNPPDEYVKTLMNDKKLFKTINKDEYYSGIEQFKDIINRDSILNLSKPNRLSKYLEKK